MSGTVTPTEPILEIVDVPVGVTSDATLTQNGNDWTLDLGDVGISEAVYFVDTTPSPVAPLIDEVSVTDSSSGSDLGLLDLNDGQVAINNGGIQALGLFYDAPFLVEEGFQPGDYTETVLIHPVDTQALVNTSSFSITPVETTTLPDITLTVNATVVCYLAGTSIATASGPVAVEDLAIGTRLTTASGDTAPVKWIGHLSVDCRRHPNPSQVWPIRIRTDAFGHGLPHRDLLLSPEHAVFTDGVLIPARHLVNGVTIAQEARDHVTYYHVELDRHDVILAEGLPCETWLDAGNRSMFANACVTDLHPSFTRDAGRAWLHDACAPLVESGPVLDAVRDRLRALAGLPPPDLAADQNGELHGWIDSATTETIRGWAWQPAHPGHSARLDILADDTVLGTIIADGQRDDVRDAGRLVTTTGDTPSHARCGFIFDLPHPLSPFQPHTIRVRRAADHAELWNSGSVTIAAAERVDAAIIDQFTAALHATAIAADNVAERAAMLLRMTAAVDRLRALCARLADGDAAAGKPLALFVDVAVPAPGRDSASQVALDHMRALQRQGFRVAFASPALTADSDVTALTAQAIMACTPPAIASVEEALRRFGDDIALVYLHRVGSASVYGALVRYHCPRALLVYNVADLHFVRVARQAALERSMARAAEARRLREQELRAVAMADRVITHSPAEAAILARQAPGARVHVVPWAFPVRRSVVPFAARAGLAFIGCYGHAPNVDAAHWLVTEIMPLVWRDAPEVACLLVGAGMPDGLRRFTDPRIQAVGHVADLACVFGQVRLTVAPLRFGAGIKGKVLESLAAGVPCVCSPVAAEGLDLSGCVGADAAELAALILRLHTDAAQNAAIAEAGVRLIETAFSNAHVDAALARAIARPAALAERLRA